MTNPSATYQVLIVKASPDVRNEWMRLVRCDPTLSLMGAVEDPFAAARLIAQSVPDLILLGLDLPQMSGRSFLKKIMAQHPMPVVICSSRLNNDPKLGEELRCLGAAGLLPMPDDQVTFLRHNIRPILDQLHAALHGAPSPPKATLGTSTKAPTPNDAKRKLKLDDKSPSPRKAIITSKLRPSTEPDHVTPKHNADVILPPPKPGKRLPKTRKIIVIGASTGGVEALQRLLSALPQEMPGMVIVQHLPGHFSSTLVQSLGNSTPLHVQKAGHGMVVERGTVLLAPCDCHTVLRRQGDGYATHLVEGPPVQRHRPSAEVLFRSAAREAGPNAIGVILTGMGDDGARTMREMYDAGAYTIAQDKASCTVFGMPMEAIKRGGVHRILHLDRIAPELVRLCAQET